MDQKIYLPLEAINYLVDNARRGSEWQEAGMWNAVERVVAKYRREPAAYFTQDELDALLEGAENN